MRRKAMANAIAIPYRLNPCKRSSTVRPPSPALTALGPDGHLRETRADLPPVRGQLCPRLRPASGFGHQGRALSGAPRQTRFAGAGFAFSAPPAQTRVPPKNAARDLGEPGAPLLG